MIGSGEGDNAGMKKIVCLVVIIVMTLMVTSCGGGGNNASDESTETSSSSAAKEPSQESDGSISPDVDEKLLSVDITLPASLFEMIEALSGISEAWNGMADAADGEIDASEASGNDDSADEILKPGDDTSEYVKENGYNSATWNDDGSLTINVSKEKFEEMKADAQKSIDDELKATEDDPERPYIETITHSPDYKEVTITVDKDGYEDAVAIFEATPSLIGFGITMNQPYLGETPGVTINIVDSKTGDVIDSVDYPEE
jgi:hypothetical protein